MPIGQLTNKTRVEIKISNYKSNSLGDTSLMIIDCQLLGTLKHELCALHAAHPLMILVL